MATDWNNIHWGDAEGHDYFTSEDMKIAEKWRPKRLGDKEAKERTKQRKKWEKEFLKRNPDALAAKKEREKALKERNRPKTARAAHAARRAAIEDRHRRSQEWDPDFKAAVEEEAGISRGQRKRASDAIKKMTRATEPWTQSDWRKGEWDEEAASAYERYRDMGRNIGSLKSDAWKWKEEGTPYTKNLQTILDYKAAEKKGDKSAMWKISNRDTKDAINPYESAQTRGIAKAKPAKTTALTTPNRTAQVKAPKEARRKVNLKERQLATNRGSGIR